MGDLLVGISSWSDHGLVNSGFYPNDVKTPDARLRYYASQFNVAELDSSYHFFPTRRNMALWLENTPAGFTFDVRAFSLFTQHPTPPTSLPRSIRERYGGEIHAKGNLYTHHLPQIALDELWAIFLSDLETFQKAGKLGAVLFQFPPWFHPSPENLDYLGTVQNRLSGYRMAVEFRVGSWLEERREDTLTFLRHRGIGLVCVDEPQGLKSSVPPVAEATAGFGMVRFHGRNTDNWERKGTPPDEIFNYLYDETELAEWAPRIREMAENTEEVHVIFKNKHADFPVRNALQMKKLLGID